MALSAPSPAWAGDSRYDWAGSISFNTSGSAHVVDSTGYLVNDLTISQTGRLTLPGTRGSGGTGPRPFDATGGVVGWSTATWTEATQASETKTTQTFPTGGSCQTNVIASYGTITSGAQLLYAGFPGYELTNDPSRLFFGDSPGGPEPFIHGHVVNETDCNEEHTLVRTDEPSDLPLIGGFQICGVTTVARDFGLDIPRSLQSKDERGRPVVRGTVTFPCDPSSVGPPGPAPLGTGSSTITFDVVGIDHGNDSSRAACANGKDDDHDGRKDYPADKGCSSAADTSEANRPPVAVADHWTVEAGHALEENVLDNDRDPDGDRLRAKVLDISFAASEYSRVEPHGDFLYTAGPGTTRTLTKTITYVAVDSSGARSKPAPGPSRSSCRNSNSKPRWSPRNRRRKPSLPSTSRSTPPESRS
jgi:hypothetical protein